MELIKGNREDNLGQNWQRIVACALATQMICVAPALAQTASQLAPPLPAEPLKPGLAPVLPPDRPPQPFVNLDGLFKIDQADLRVENIPPGLTKVTQALLAPHQAQPLLSADAAKLGVALERTYAGAGFILARVSLVPPSPDRPNQLKFRVISGFIERVDVEGLSPRVRARAKRLLVSVTRQPWLTASTLNRKLLLINELPGVSVSAVLAKGVEFGGAVLVVRGRADGLHATAGAANTLGANLDRINSNLALESDDLLGQGEQAVIQASGDFGYHVLTTDPRFRALVAQLSAPVFEDGLKFDLSFIDVSNHPITPVNSPPFMTSFEKLSLGLSYPFILAPTGSVSGAVTLDAQTDRRRLATTPKVDIDLDQTRVLRTRLDFINRAAPFNGVVWAQVQQSFGLDGFGAHNPNEASVFRPLSRQGADTRFWATEASWLWRQPLPFGVTLNDTGKAQTSYGQPLLRSEQIGLTGVDALTVFTDGTLQGDYGFETRLEQSTNHVLWGQAISPYIFEAVGGMGACKPTAVERAYVRVAAGGIGVRASLLLPFHQELAVNAELGGGWRSDRIPTKNRLTLAITKRLF